MSIPEEAPKESFGGNSVQEQSEAYTQFDQGIKNLNIDQVRESLKSDPALINTRLHFISDLHHRKKSLTPLHVAVANYNAHSEMIIMVEQTVTPEDIQLRAEIISVLLSYAPDIDERIPMFFVENLGSTDFQARMSSLYHVASWELAALSGRKELALLILRSKSGDTSKEIERIEQLYHAYRHEWSIPAPEEQTDDAYYNPAWDQGDMGGSSMTPFSPGYVSGDGYGFWVNDDSDTSEE